MEDLLLNLVCLNHYQDFNLLTGENKQYDVKALPKGFLLKGNTTEFHPQTKS